MQYSSASDGPVLKPSNISIDFRVNYIRSFFLHRCQTAVQLQTAPGLLQNTPMLNETRADYSCCSGLPIDRLWSHRLADFNTHVSPCNFNFCSPLLGSSAWICRRFLWFPSFGRSRDPDQRQGLLHPRDGVQGVALPQEEEVLRGPDLRRVPRALRKVRQGLEQVNHA